MSPYVQYIGTLFGSIRIYEVPQPVCEQFGKQAMSSAWMTFSSTVAAKASAKPDRGAMLSRLFRMFMKQTRHWLTAPLSGAQPSTKFIHATVKTTSLVCA
ncbi:hypothetical protein [Shigella flexneri]|uniref:hypothetical protein n=1 Tax=Shigella flexneri TaxID=623 RepID=UPI0020950909|nr:hypothetical protein [Shigella flexneri]